VRNTCCPGIRHACMGLFWLHLYLLRCVHGQFVEDRAVMTSNDRCENHEFWCHTWHNCDCVYWSLDDSDCCQKCGWGKYRDRTTVHKSTSDLYCVPCADTTILTDYKWDPRTQHPCLSCGKAFEMADKYTKFGGWGDPEYKSYTNPFDAHGALSCIKDRTKKCEESARKLADLMVVSVNSGIRTCGFCHPAKYFFNGKCVECPLGMQSATPLDNSNLFIPEDVKLANPADGSATGKENRVPAEFPVANFAEFGCRACSVSQGVRNQDTQCTPCQTNEYQLETRVDIQGRINTHKSPGSFGNLQLYLGTSCGKCPAGYEFYNQKLKSLVALCRSIEPLKDCCRICNLNEWSANGGTCTKVALPKTTEKPYGATRIIDKCQEGEEILHCRTDGSGECKLEANQGWRTCRKCDNTKNKDCQECNGDKSQNLDIFNGTQCIGCSTCQILEKSTTTEIVYKVEPPEMEHIVQRFGENIKQHEGEWWRTVVKSTCAPLPRRTIQKGIITPSSVDYFRPLGQHTQMLPVRDFETLAREEKSCTIKRCDAVCRGFFLHSPGCGQQETRVQYIFVENKNGQVGKSEVSSEDMLNITHGPCTPCTACSKGNFNERCNVYANTHLPAGGCFPCITECALDQFMYHSHGEGACHNPAINYEAFPSGSNKWKIKEDYVCKKCPTWVYETKAGNTIPATMKTVTACGERQQYMTYGWDEASRLQAVLRNVEYSKHQNDIELGNTYKKFRHFHRDLVPYCPEAHYYNTKNPNCNTDQDSETYIVPATDSRTVTIGYRVYNPECCDPCTTCALLQKKDTANWRACKGDSTEDTQNHCVDRCGAMSYQNETAKTCNACATCQAGLLTP